MGHHYYKQRGEPEVAHSRSSVGCTTTNPVLHPYILLIEYKGTLTEASLILPSPAASLAILLMMGETLVGPYNWILGRQFWYASTTPWISGQREQKAKWCKHPTSVLVSKQAPVNESSLKLTKTASEELVFSVYVFMFMFYQTFINIYLSR